MKSKYIAVGGGQCADLITVRGLKRLQSADIVLYDRLADETLLDGLSAEKIMVGKTPYGCGATQDEINGLIGKHLTDGKCVVRLKGGDSLLFSRVAEEIFIARSVGAEIEIVPGVTTASAAMAKAECALTDREHTSGVIFITGHAKNGLPDYDWAMLANCKLTIVVYMGMKNILHITAELMKHGYPADTSLLIADRVETEDESMAVTTVAALDNKMVEGLKGPAIFIIGRVLEDNHER